MFRNQIESPQYDFKRLRRAISTSTALFVFMSSNAAFARGFGQSLDMRCLKTEFKQTLEGAKVAEFKTGGKLTASPILLADGDTIVIASEDGALYFLDTKLNLKQKVEIGGAIRNTPLEVTRSKESRGLLFLAADGKTDKAQAEAVLINPKNFQIVSRRKLTYSHVDSSPIEVAEGFVITSSNRVKERDFEAENRDPKKGEIYRSKSDASIEVLDAATLEPAVAAFKIPGSDIYSSPSADMDGLILLPTVSTRSPGTGVLLLLNPETGLPVKAVLTGASYSMPYLYQAPNGQTAIILGESGPDGGIRIYRRDSNLTQFGSLDRKPGTGGVISTASPIGKNLIVVGTGWGELVAINTTRLNEVLKEATVSGKYLEKIDGLLMRVELSGNLTGSATETSDGSVVIGNENGDLFFLDKNLKLLAKFREKDSGRYYGFPLALSDGSVVVAAGNGKVFQVRTQLSAAEPIKVRTRCDAEENVPAKVPAKKPEKKRGLRN